MQTVHHQLRVVVYVGFLGIEHAQRPTKTLAHRFLGELGLEDVLEAQCLFFWRDGQQVRLVILQCLELNLFGGDDQREVRLDAVVLDRTFDGHLGFHDHLAFVQRVGGMGQEDDVLRALGHVVLHQCLVILGKIAPGFLTVGSVVHVDGLVHIHQVGQGIDHDGMHIRHVLCGIECLINLQWIGDGELLELGSEGEFLRLCSRVLARHPPQHYLQLMVSHKTRLYLHPSRVFTTSRSLDLYSLTG